MSGVRTIKQPWFRYTKPGGLKLARIAYEGDTVDLSDEDIERGEAKGAFVESESPVSADDGQGAGDGQGGDGKNAGAGAGDDGQDSGDSGDAKSSTLKAKAKPSKAAAKPAKAKPAK